MEIPKCGLQHLISLDFFKCLISPSILKIQGRLTIFSRAHKTLLVIYEQSEFEEEGHPEYKKGKERRIKNIEYWGILWFVV